VGATARRSTETLGPTRCVSGHFTPSTLTLKVWSHSGERASLRVLCLEARPKVIVITLNCSDFAPMRRRELQSISISEWSRMRRRIAGTHSIDEKSVRHVRASH
jgi:hypothetical protein